jgi:hypothetical protein
MHAHGAKARYAPHSPSILDQGAGAEHPQADASIRELIHQIHDRSVTDRLTDRFFSLTDGTWLLAGCELGKGQTDFPATGPARLGARSRRANLERSRRAVSHNAAGRPLEDRRMHTLLE